jgi:hypothetical protein
LSPEELAFSKSLTLPDAMPNWRRPARKQQTNEGKPEEEILSLSVAAETLKVSD